LLSSYSKATDMPSYIQLVRELEKQFPDRDSLGVLAMLRQAYYGKPWSVETTPQWGDVLPGGGEPGNPASRIGSGPGSLFEALKASQEVAGTDMGHVFTGLQAFFHPTSDVDLTKEILGQSVIVATVDMPNTEFATWGGDIGAATARPVIDDELGRPVKSDDDYFAAEASDQDLEGDLDAYAIVTGGGGARGLQAMLQAPGTAAPGTPWSAASSTGSRRGSEGGRGSHASAPLRALRPPSNRVGSAAMSFAAPRGLAVSVERLYQAFVDESLRERWLPDGELRERTATRPTSARFDWGDGQARVNVTFLARGEAKSTATLEHARLVDAEQAERMKAWWRELLAALKSQLEGGEIDA
jgi:uncharacterized protein YndB with AHSA1/START domain